MGLFTELKERHARRLSYRSGTVLKRGDVQVKKERCDAVPSGTKERYLSRKSSYGSAISEAHNKDQDPARATDRTKSAPSKGREREAKQRDPDEYVIVEDKEQAVGGVGLPKSRDEMQMFILRFIIGLVHPSPIGNHGKKSEPEPKLTLPITSLRIMHAIRALMRDTGAPKDVADVFSEHAVFQVLCDLQDGFPFGIEFTPLHDGTKSSTARESEGQRSSSRELPGGILTKVDVAILTKFAPMPLDLNPIVPKIMSRKRKVGSNGDEEASRKKTSSSAKLFSATAIPDKDDDVDALVNVLSTRQKLLFEAGEELRELLYCPTVKQSRLAKKFVNKHRTAQEFCTYGSRRECSNASRIWRPCDKIHFRKLTNRWTDEMLGDCSYLDTCRHMATCKFVHYTLDLSQDQVKALEELGIENCGTDTKRFNEVNLKGVEFPPQWLQCDVRTLDLSIFQGIVSVIMADPPWDIHMELPYGTMTDDEMRSLKLQDAQTDGMLFLWVTGRASELARECMKLWGYKRVEEIIWVKTNQLQRIIRTGRTGHWINHSKEHCLVGIKGNPVMNRNLDCDVIVSEVRETSRKPDEVYNLIERMFPNTLKIELFGRPHNVHTNWITLGNQLDGNRICHEELAKRYNNKYPDDPVVPFSREDALKSAENAKTTSASQSSGARRAGIPAAIENVPWRPEPKEAKTKEPEPWRPPPQQQQQTSTSDMSSSSMGPSTSVVPTQPPSPNTGPRRAMIGVPPVPPPAIPPFQQPSFQQAVHTSINHVRAHRAPPPPPPPIPPTLSQQQAFLSSSSVLPHLQQQPMQAPSLFQHQQQQQQQQAQMVHMPPPTMQGPPVSPQRPASHYNGYL